MSEARITVHRWTVNCSLPRNHPSPHLVRQRLDEVLAKELRAALAQLLAPLDSLGDEVILIPRLELSFALDVSQPLAVLAQKWAAQVAAAVAACLRPEAQRVARFADEAAYRAQFLVDVAAGRRDAWYLGPFRGWRSLSTSAALRSALIEDEALGMAALSALPRGELVAVLRALGPVEARRVVETFAQMADQQQLDAVAAQLTAFVSEWLGMAAALPDPFCAGLALLAVASSAIPPERRSTAAQLAAAIAAWRSDEAPNDFAAGMGAPSAAARPSLLPLATLAPSAREPLAKALGKEAAPSEPPPSYTRFGGLLLLLPRVAELPIDRVWRAPEDRACARLVILSRAAGAARSAAVLADPVLRRLCGVAGDAAIDEWLAAEEACIAGSLARALFERRFAEARAVRLSLARRRGQPPLAITVAAPDGYWLTLAPLDAEMRAQIGRAEGLVVDERPVNLDSSAALARGATLMLAYVTPAFSPLGGEAERALSLAAQQVLRAFARRLPGFSESSPAHLWRNFLEFDATIVEGGEMFACRVGRPPLAALLGVTGALRSRVPLGFGDAVLDISSR